MTNIDTDVGIYHCKRVRCISNYSELCVLMNSRR